MLVTQTLSFTQPVTVLQGLFLWQLRSQTQNKRVLWSEQAIWTAILQPYATQSGVRKEPWEWARASIPVHEENTFHSLTLLPKHSGQEKKATKEKAAGFIMCCRRTSLKSEARKAQWKWAPSFLAAAKAKLLGMADEKGKGYRNKLAE